MSMDFRDWSPYRYVSDQYMISSNPPMAIIMNLTLFKFFISHRVPKGAPCRFTETFTSQRREPCNP